MTGKVATTNYAAMKSSAGKSRVIGWNPFKRNQRKQRLEESGAFGGHTEPGITSSASEESTRLSVSSMDNDQGFCDASEDVIDISPSSSELDISSPRQRTIGHSQSSIESPFASSMDLNELSASSFCAATFDSLKINESQEISFDQPLKVKDFNARFDDFDPSTQFEVPFPCPEKVSKSPDKVGFSDQTPKESSVIDFFGEKENNFPEAPFADYKSPINDDDREMFFSHDEGSTGFYAPDDEGSLPQEDSTHLPEQKTKSTLVEDRSLNRSGNEQDYEECDDIDPGNENMPAGEQGADENRSESCEESTRSRDQQHDSLSSDEQENKQKNNDENVSGIRNTYRSRLSTKARLAGRPFRSRLKNALATKSPSNNFRSPVSSSVSTIKAKDINDPLPCKFSVDTTPEERRQPLTTTPRSKELWSKSTFRREINDTEMQPMQPTETDTKVERSTKGLNSEELEMEQEETTTNEKEKEDETTTNEKKKEDETTTNEKKKEDETTTNEKEKEDKTTTNETENVDETTNSEKEKEDEQNLDKTEEDRAHALGQSTEKSGSALEEMSQNMHQKHVYVSQSSSFSRSEDFSDSILQTKSEGAIPSEYKQNHMIREKEDKDTNEADEGSKGDAEDYQKDDQLDESYINGHGSSLFAPANTIEDSTFDKFNEGFEIQQEESNQGSFEKFGGSVGAGQAEQFSSFNANKGFVNTAEMFDNVGFGPNEPAIVKPEGMGASFYEVEVTKQAEENGCKAVAEENVPEIKNDNDREANECEPSMLEGIELELTRSDTSGQDSTSTDDLPKKPKRRNFLNRQKKTDKLLSRCDTEEEATDSTPLVQWFNDANADIAFEENTSRWTSTLDAECDGHVELDLSKVPPPPPPPPLPQKSKTHQIPSNSSGLVKVHATGKTPSNVIYWSGETDDFEIVAVAPSKRLVDESQMWVDGTVHSQSLSTEESGGPKVPRPHQSLKSIPQVMKDKKAQQGHSFSAKSHASTAMATGHNVIPRKWHSSSPRTQGILALLGQPGVEQKQLKIGDTISPVLLTSSACSTLSDSASDDDSSYSSSSCSSSSVASDSAILSISPSGMYLQENGIYKNPASLLGTNSAGFGASISKGSNSYSRHLSASSSDEDIFSSIDDDTSEVHTTFLENNAGKRSFLSCTPSCQTAAAPSFTSRGFSKGSRDTLSGSGTMGTMASRIDSIIDESISSASSNDFSSDSQFEFDNVEHHVQMAQEWLLKMKSAFLGKEDDHDDDSATMDGTIEPSTVQCEYAGVLGRLKIDINKNKK